MRRIIRASVEDISPMERRPFSRCVFNPSRGVNGSKARKGGNPCVIMGKN